MDIWTRLRQEGVLHVDPALGSWTLHAYPEAYDWMRRQMSQRLLDYRGHYPWWGRLRPKPDLRGLFGRCAPCGAPMARLELSLPARRCLFSHEMAWHMVLAQYYVGFGHEDSERWEAELDLAGIDEFRRPLAEPWRSQLILSWDRIFEPERLIQTGEWSETIQATFECLYVSDVVAVTEFVSRGPTRWESCLETVDAGLSDHDKPSESSH